MQKKTDKTNEAGTLPKGLVILKALGDHPDGVRLTTLAQITGMANSTTHRVIATLVSYGFVDYDEDKRLFSLGLQLFQLAHKVSQAKGYTEAALQVMRELSAKTGCTIVLNVLDGKEVVVLERVDPPKKLRVAAEIGSREPVYSTSTGKAILASLPDDELAVILKGLNFKALTTNTITNRRALTAELKVCQERGFSMANEENEPGFSSIGVAIPTRFAQRRAALAIASPTFLTTMDELITYAPLVKAAAEEIGVRILVP